MKEGNIFPKEANKEFWGKKKTCSLKVICWSCMYGEFLQYTSLAYWKVR